MVALRAVIIVVQLALVHGALAATLTVTPDRTEVFENESFNVEFVYSDELREQPAFDVLLKDFQIIATQPSSNLTSINGRFRYEFSFNLTLMPKRTGTLTVPAIAFDDIESEPLQIKVKPAPDGDALKTLGDLHLEVTMTPDRGYVQGQFMFTQRLYHRGWLAGGKLSPPTFGDSDAVVKAIEQAKRYSLFRDGERYQIYEQSYLVFPQSSGRLTAEATNFTGQLREPGRPPRLKRVSAAPVVVDVEGVPDSMSADGFLPASKVTLVEEWPNSDSVTQGQPVTRQVVLTAVGQMSSQLRALELPEIDGVRVYADQPKREDAFAQNGVTGTLTQSLALVPQRPGEVTLPAVQVRWWDVVNGVERIAELKPRTLNVAPAPLSASGPTDGGVTLNPRAPGPAPPKVAPPGWPYWPPLAMSFAGLWLLTATAWWRERRRGPAPKVASEKQAKTAKRRLFRERNAVKRACDAGDPRAATQALLDWAAVIFGRGAPRSLGDLAARLDGAAASEIARLEATRYGPNPIWDEPDRLWRAVAGRKPERARAPRSDAQTLATL